MAVRRSRVPTFFAVTLGSFPMHDASRRIRSEVSKEGGVNYTQVNRDLCVHAGVLALRVRCVGDGCACYSKVYRSALKERDVRSETPMASKEGKGERLTVFSQCEIHVD